MSDGSSAPSPGGLKVDGSPVPLGSTATYEPIVITRDLWARWKPLDKTMTKYKMIGMSIKGQTVAIITRADSGINKGIVWKLTEKGFLIIATDIAGHERSLRCVLW
ncbi:hypothetical protein [Desulfurococcus amylolyticus]|uniref:hypothetical protein n=1 Tax=Desulfurococcus amylolyticus TaxID=94694 RepID=UPI00022E1740|nr:hypothetical protein [Desulfurococcus amylolyticus]